MLAALRCGGGNGANAGATAADVTASCNAYCDSYIAKACPDPFYSSAVVCKTDEACDSMPPASASCYAAAKAYYDCEKGQPDICADDGCDSQFTTYDTTCP